MANKNTFCCEMMTYHLNEFFKTPVNEDNFDVVMKFFSKSGVYGIPIYDGGTSVIAINYCPWCGIKLPETED